MELSLVARCVTRGLTPAVLVRLLATRACPVEQPRLREQSSVSYVILETYSVQDGASACLSCVPGYYHADGGASACEACGFGELQPGICKHLRGM